MKISRITIKLLTLIFATIFIIAFEIRSENTRITNDFAKTTRLEENIKMVPIIPSSLINFEFELHQGWNLISIPVRLLTNNLTDVLRPISGKYYSVWAYDFETGWKQYFPGELGEIFNNLDTIEHGKGYWINASEECSFTVTGLKIEDTAIQLHSGWNLVGYNRLEALTIEEALYTIKDKIKYFWTYQAGEGWIEYSQDLANIGQNNLKLLKPGMAYWINAIEDCTWDIGEHKILEPIQKYKQKVFSVKNYGARGDGNTDDTKAIQSALDDVISSGGGIVVFPEGVYMISTPLKVISAQNILLEGVGDSSVIVSSADSENAIQVYNSNGITLKSIKIEHNGTNYAVIAKGNSNRFTIEGATINSKKSAIVLEDASQAKIRNCKLYSSDDTVILTTYTDTNKNANLQKLELQSNYTNQVKYVATQKDLTNGNTERLENTLFASSANSRSINFTHGYNVIEDNIIIQDYNYSGINVQTGRNRIIGNTIVGKLSEDSSVGIFINSGDQYIGSNYIYGFNHGIQIGSKDSTMKVGMITVLGNIIRSCNIGIVTLTWGSFSIQANHIVITDDGQWRERIGYYLGNKYSSITGGSVSYETLLDYKETKSRRYKGIVISDDVETTVINNLNLLNLEYGVIGNGYKVSINGCLFNNIDLGIGDISDNNTSYNVRDTVFKNVAYSRVNGNLLLDSCEFRNDRDFISVNKAYAQFKIENDNYCLVRNCRFTNVLDTCITNESGYYLSDDYGRADIEIRDDNIRIDSGLDWLDISYKFERLNIPLQTGREYFVYSDNKKYFYTLNGIITYGSGEPTAGTWNSGDRVENTNPVAGGNMGWVCVSSGTIGALADVRGSIIGGSNVLVLNSIAGLKKGQWIKISESTEPKKIIGLNPSNNIAILDSNVNVTYNGAKISYSPAIFKPYGRINY